MAGRDVHVGRGGLLTPENISNVVESQMSTECESSKIVKYCRGSGMEMAFLSNGKERCTLHDLTPHDFHARARGLLLKEGNSVAQ